MTSRDDQNNLSEPTFAGRSGGRGEPGELVISQLLCARLCHDLIGLSAAINAGEELIREGDGGDDARDLITDSARQLSGRLAFFRALFGAGSSMGGNTGGMSVREMRALAEGFLLGGRVSLAWDIQGCPDGQADRIGYGDAARLLLGLVMLSAEALPRGGEIRIRLRRTRRGVNVQVRAAGPRVRLTPDVRQALQGQNADALGPRTIHAFHLSRLARRAGATLQIEANEGETLRIDFKVPAEQSRPAA